MRHSCEMIVVDILPVVRKELAVELVRTYGMRKVAVARLFGISGTAISQYVHGSRGNRSMLESNSNYEEFMNEIKLSAERLASKKSEPVDELCRLCKTAKKMGLLAHVHDELKEKGSLHNCPECPRDGVDTNNI
ncbi:MAG: transcriptional regulator [Methanomassiliicoccaceae archaeon]|nr:transcriptional regulator [Methanomassiliicoccaceae archaeon]